MTFGLPRFKLRSLTHFLGRSAPRVPRADKIVGAGELVRGNPAEHIRLPMLPQAGTGTTGIEYSAASVLERVVLGALVRRERPSRLFEIGTFRGVTALVMAVNAPDGATLWTLDLPQEMTAGTIAAEFYSTTNSSGYHKMAAEGAERMVGLAFRDYSGPCRIEQVFGDAARFDFRPYAPVDLFFVDGCHAYDAAKRDTLSAWGCLRSGGLLVWHDYTWDSVQEAVRDTALNVPVTHVEQTSLAFARKP